MKKLVSGIQPTGIPTLGNYLGAIKNFIKLSKEHESYIFIADLHAITQKQDPKELYDNIYSLAAIYIACGLDTENTNLFIQSKNTNHALGGWIATTQTGLGELNRMTQFKDKKSKFKEDHIPVGLLTYPSLQAADIFIYEPSIVPVGIDQKQHLELTKIIVNRINSRYKLDILVPEVNISENTKKIMSLQNPEAKMSKSDEKQLATIFLDDDFDTISKKLKKAVTDSEGKVYYDIENKPGISNLMSIYSSVTNKNYDDIEKQFEGENYGVFKQEVANAIFTEIEPIQKRYFELINNREKIDQILNKGLENAINESNKVMDKLMKGIGLK